MVKGSTLHTAGRHFPTVLGQARWDAIVAKLPADTQRLLDSADFNEWYPEWQLRRVVHLLFEDAAEGDRERFLELVRGMTTAGISRFFRLLINFSSGAFALRKIPIMWDRFRQGPASVESEVTGDGRVLLHYTDYAYASDPVYRLLSVGNVQAIVYAATRKIPDWQVVCFDDDSMTLAFVIP